MKQRWLPTPPHCGSRPALRTFMLSMCVKNCVNWVLFQKKCWCQAFSRVCFALLWHQEVGQSFHCRHSHWSLKKGLFISWLVFQINNCATRSWRKMVWGDQKVLYYSNYLSCCLKTVNSWSSWYFYMADGPLPPLSWIPYFQSATRTIFPAQCSLPGHQ